MNNTKLSLMPKVNMDASEEEFTETRMSIADGTASLTNIERLRKNIEQRKKAVGVLIEEEQVSSSLRLAGSKAALDSILVDPEVLEAVKQGIIDSKDPAKAYCDFAKATNELNRRLQAQYDSNFSADGLLGGKKNQKIQIAFGNGKLAVAVDMNGDNNG